MRTEVQVMRTEADGSVRRRNCQEKMRAHLSKDINTGRAFSPHLPPGLVRLNSLPSDTKLYGRSLRGFQSWGDFQIGFEWSCAVWLVMLWCHGECWEFRTFPVSILNLDQASLSIARYWQQLMGSIPGWETKIPHAVGCSQKVKKIFGMGSLVKAAAWPTLSVNLNDVGFSARICRPRNCLTRFPVRTKGGYFRIQIAKRHSLLSCHEHRRYNAGVQHQLSKVITLSRN